MLALGSDCTEVSGMDKSDTVLILECDAGLFEGLLSSCAFPCRLLGDGVLGTLMLASFIRNVIVPSVLSR